MTEVVDRSLLEVEQAADCQLRSRSALYGEALKGSSGVNQEGILDYVLRLAYCHHLRARDLLERIVLPAAGMQDAVAENGTIETSRLVSVVGMGRSAASFVSAIAQLTGRMDLRRGSLLAWSRLLTGRGAYLTNYRRWCARCIGDRLKRGDVFFNLSWTIGIAEACPLHRTLLNIACATCGRKQPILGDLHHLGICKFCRESLSRMRPNKPTDRQLHFGRAITEMVEACNQYYEQYFSTENFIHRLRFAADVLHYKSPGALLTAVDLRRSLVPPPSGRISLTVLLEITYRLGVTPVAFLTGSMPPAIDGKAFAFLGPANKHDREGKRERVADALEKALGDRTAITTRRALCSIAGVNERSLDSLFPDVAPRLAKHNGSVRRELQRVRIGQKQARIGAAVDALVADGGPFTARRRVAVLRGLGFDPRDPSAREYFKFVLARRLDGPG